MKHNGIIFLYKKFTPILLGSDVHGYNLAKKLHQQGREIFIAHKQQDGFTRSMRGKELITALKRSSVAYLRVSLKYPFKVNTLGFVFKLFGKKLILELNAPIEELRFSGESERTISFYKGYFRLLLSFTDGIVVVSEPIKRYLKKEYNFHNVAVIPNGGETFEYDPLKEQNISEAHRQFNAQYTRQVVWVANYEYIQGKTKVIEICRQLTTKQVGIVIVDNSEDGALAKEISGEHIHFLRSPSRDEIAVAVSNAMAGFAFYDTKKYSLLGMEFFNSPLKIYEYIANGVKVITNLSEHELPSTENMLITATNPEDIVAKLDKMEGKAYPDKFRSWEHVADETWAFFQTVVNG